MIKFGDSVNYAEEHVANTSDIWHFKIVSEGAVASGIRRIEAITSDAQKNILSHKLFLLKKLKKRLRMLKIL
jgi:alanyl-tRNA synthetase